MILLDNVITGEKGRFNTIGQLEYNTRSAIEYLRDALVDVDSGNINRATAAYNKAARLLNGSDGGELTDADCEKLVNALGGF